jgi:predicted anti-sigma-YlaC factor YlaD
MRCEQCREIVSARVDGEDGPGEWDAASTHLRQCAACRAFLSESERLHRLTRLRPVEDVPDLTARIVAAAGIAPGEREHPPAHDGTRPLRVVLGAAALLQIALALPALLFGDDANLPVHIARHIGSFDVALAVGYLWVAWRPSRALAGVFPIAAALVACLVGSSVLDVVMGRAAASGEMHHITDLIGLGAMWLLGARSLVGPIVRRSAA